MRKLHVGERFRKLYEMPKSLLCLTKLAFVRETRAQRMWVVDDDNDDTSVISCKYLTFIAIFPIHFSVTKGIVSMQNLPKIPLKALAYSKHRIQI